MEKLSDYRTFIEQSINDLQFPGGDLESLYAPIAYGLSAGGKRLRPVLVLMGCDAYNGEYRKALKPALGIEMFHNFTLLHDDVMDKSDMRRGRLTVHKKYNENAAILSGDTMLTLASEFVSDVEDNILRKITESFNRMAIEVYEGQSLDMDFESLQEVTSEQYLRMIELKTGALLGASVKIGSLIGGASDKDANLMDDFGRKIGIAFQVQDDYLDTFGDSTKFGKQIGGDINNGKKTFLYVSMKEMSAQYSEALKAAYSIPAGEQRVKTVTRLYEKAGMPELCKNVVNKYLSQALRSLNSTSLTQSAKEAFYEFAEKLIGRKK